MSRLLARDVYSERDDVLFLEEMNALTRRHMEGCAAFARIRGGWKPAARIEDIPFVHVGLFKRMELKTEGEDVVFKRIVQSSSTSGVSSHIALDEKSSQDQSESVRKILADFIGTGKRPLLILDSVKSLRRRGALSARIAAAMSLQPLASDVQFLLDDPENPESMKWDALNCALKNNEELIVYGFSWILWLAWGAKTFPDGVRTALKKTKISFVHSGGWKKLEAIRLDAVTFNTALLRSSRVGSKVVDFYGLVEQMGIIYPLCEHGSRHVPVWADVIVRDSYTLQPLHGKMGQLQLLNTISYGAPYHSVLTEDIGRTIPGDCPCGRTGRRFEFIGRVPKAEVRGCANV